MTTKDDLFRSLYEHRRGVLSFFLRSGFDREQAEDLSQDTFLRAYEGLDSWRRESEWYFLRTIASRVALNAVRSEGAAKRSASQVSLEELPWELAAADDQAGALIMQEEIQVEAARLNEAVASLPAGLRAPILLRLQGKPYQQISTELGISLGYVKLKLHEAKVALRSRLAELPARG